MRWQYITDAIYAGGFFGRSIDRGELESRLKERNEQGWELVSVLPLNGFYGVTREVLIIFRRPLT